MNFTVICGLSVLKLENIELGVGWYNLQLEEHNSISYSSFVSTIVATLVRLSLSLSVSKSLYMGLAVLFMLFGLWLCCLGFCSLSLIFVSSLISVGWIFPFMGIISLTLISLVFDLISLV